MENPFFVELSVWMGGRGCGHFIYFSFCWSVTIALSVMNSPANYVSEAEDMTTLIILSMDSTGTLLWGIGSLSEKKMCDPARLWVQVSLRYSASECADKIMFLGI